MATTVKDIKALLVAAITTLGVFKQVVGYAEGNFSSYPAATIRPTGGSGRVIDTHRNERTFNFAITLFQEQGEPAKNKAQADQILTDCTDAVITAFDQDKDLNGNVEIVRVVAFEMDFKDRPGTYDFATIRVDVVAIVPSYN